MIDINTVLLAAAIWPGQTAYQLADRLGVRATHAGRRQAYPYPVRKRLEQLAREGYVRSRMELGGRGNLGRHRVWYATGCQS